MLMHAIQGIIAGQVGWCASRQACNDLKLELPSNLNLKVEFRQSCLSFHTLKECLQRLMVTERAGACLGEHCKASSEVAVAMLRITQSLVYNSRLNPRLPATLVLGFTKQRLTDMIDNVCLSWPGPISAAVYLPLMVESPDNEEKIAEAATYLTTLGERSEIHRVFVVLAVA